MSKVESKPYVFRIKDVDGREFAKMLEPINGRENIAGFENIDLAEKWIDNHIEENEYVILQVYKSFHPNIASLPNENTK